MNDFICCINIDKPKLIFIAETWWNVTSIPYIDGYSLFRRDRASKGGGVAIYVSNDISSSEVINSDLSNKNEHIWCEIKIQNEKILLECICRSFFMIPVNQ
jgi:hypothetical protein